MNLDIALTELGRDPHADYDVAEVALYLAREEYPQLDVDAYLDQLRDLARDAKAHVSGSLTEQVLGLCRYLFHELGYHGNAKDYYDPRNSYLSDVMDRLTGIPITLSLVTIAVGQRLGLPLAGLGLPGHFVVQCLDVEPSIFVDPFHGGRHITLDQCQAMVTRVTGINLPISPMDLWPVPPGPFIQRLLNNLRGIYLKQEDWRRSTRILSRLHQLNPTDVQVLRDLGVCHIHQHQPGKAIDPLTAYLASAPEADDHDKIRTLWQAAKRDVGKWN